MLILSYNSTAGSSGIPARSFELAHHLVALPLSLITLMMHHKLYDVACYDTLASKY